MELFLIKRCLREQKGNIILHLLFILLHSLVFSISNAARKMSAGTSNKLFSHGRTPSTRRRRRRRRPSSSGLELTSLSTCLIKDFQIVVHSFFPFMLARILLMRNISRRCLGPPLKPVWKGFLSCKNMLEKPWSSGSNSCL